MSLWTIGQRIAESSTLTGPVVGHACLGNYWSQDLELIDTGQIMDVATHSLSVVVLPGERVELVTPEIQRELQEGVELYVRQPEEIDVGESPSVQNGGIALVAGVTDFQPFVGMNNRVWGLQMLRPGPIYNPTKFDPVVGQIIDYAGFVATNRGFLVDIGAPWPAYLPGAAAEGCTPSSPIRAHIGDYVLCLVSGVSGQEITLLATDCMGKTDLPGYGVLGQGKGLGECRRLPVAAGRWLTSLRRQEFFLQQLYQDYGQYDIALGANGWIWALAKGANEKE